MKSGCATSEFLLAAAYAVLAGIAVVSLIAVAPQNPLAALAVCPAVGMLIYMAVVLANNYGENRYRLKVQDAQIASEDAHPPRRIMGFAEHLDSERNDEEEDEQDDEQDE